MAAFSPNGYLRQQFVELTRPNEDSKPEKKSQQEMVVGAKFLSCVRAAKARYRNILYVDENRQFAKSIQEHGGGG
eukprot:8636116-Lingulodinium_polyedra.AAC.1